MPGESVDVVRMRMEPTAHPRRRLEERLFLRLPRVYDFVARRIWRLPHRSRLRRFLIRRLVRTTWEAFNRGDLDAAFIPYHEECRSTFPPDFGTVGMETPQGRSERIRFQRSLVEVWGNLSFEPEELIDLADSRFLSLGRMRGTGRGSGAQADLDWFVLITVADGRVMEERIYINRRAALEAAGLAE